MALGLAGDAIKIGIVYEAANRQVIQNAITDTKKLQEATKNGTEEAKKLEIQERRLREEMERSRAKTQQMRISMIQLSAVMAAVIALYSTLSKNSDALRSVNERVSAAFGRMAGVLGDAVAPQLRTFVDLMEKAAKALEDFDKKNPGAIGAGASAGPVGFFSNFFANKVDPGRVQRLNDQKQKDMEAMQSQQTQRMLAEYAIQIAQAQGDSVKALNLQLALKRKLLENDKDLSVIQKKELLPAFDKMAAAQKEQLRMAELGLKTYQQIGKDFKKDVVGAFRSGVSDPIYDLLQGKKLNLQDLIEPLRSGLNRAIANAIGDMFVTKAFGKGTPFEGLGKFFGVGKDKTDPTAKAVEEAGKKQDTKMNELIRTMEQVARCACSTASNTGATAVGMSVVANNIGRFGGYSGISGLTATITGGGGGGWMSALGGIAGLVGSIGGIAGGIGKIFGGRGGGGDGGYETPGGRDPIITTGGGGPEGFYASGGWVRARRYASGGEVPAFVQPGEFVVRRGVAQENKDVLEGMHRGEPVKGTGGHVFLIKTNDANSFVEHLATPAARSKIEIQIMKAIMENGNVRETIKNFSK